MNTCYHTKLLEWAMKAMGLFNMPSGRSHPPISDKTLDADLDLKYKMISWTWRYKQTSGFIADPTMKATKQNKHSTLSSSFAIVWVSWKKIEHLFMRNVGILFSQNSEVGLGARKIFFCQGLLTWHRWCRWCPWMFSDCVYSFANVQVNALLRTATDWWLTHSCKFWGWTWS